MNKLSPPKGDYHAIVIWANKCLERDGEPFKFTASGIAVCKECSLTWFPNERSYPACEHFKEWNGVKGWKSNIRPLTENQP
jgi:hypothetical protein